MANNIDSGVQKDLGNSDIHPEQKDDVQSADAEIPLNQDERSSSNGKKGSAQKIGAALIKPEYIDTDHVKRVEEKYLPTDTVQALKEEKALNENDSSEPPAKKAKLKGRNKNKNRPREKRQDISERPCVSLMRGRECSYGDKCKFMHDFKKYMDSKPQDLGDKCHLYRTYGRCNFSISCRYAKDHLSEDLKNIFNDELVKKWNGTNTVMNILSKDLQRKLWKRSYNFKKAENTFQRVKADIDAKKKDGTGNPSNVNRTLSESNNLDNNNANLDKLERPNPELTVPEKAEGNLIYKPDSLITETNITKSGPVTDEDTIKLRPVERKKIDFSDKLYLAPLTTVGNLPFRRICKEYGADITCGEMAMATNILQGQQSEWALLRRHSSEDIFGVQLCGSYPDSMSRCAQLLCENTDIDFIDINCGCPIDMVYKKGEGSALMGRHSKLENIVKSMQPVMSVPLTLKMRTGIMEDKNIAHQLVPKLRDWGVSLVTIHGRSREQRYTRLANWDYIEESAKYAAPMPIFGNGDILSYEDANAHRARTGLSGLMLARGALIKPWVFTEIKEQRHWDISSSERFEMLRRYTNAGLEHWGSDQQGISNTRRFLLEWISFLHRYIPVGILERVPQKINEKPPYYFGRDDMETLMASTNCADWIKISEMLLGPVPGDFTFLPKHRANAYS